MFCDAFGKPRLRSVQEANATGENGFLYVKEFRILPEFRDDPRVGEAAIRKLLCKTKLAGTWSLAVYLSDPRVYYNEEDKLLAMRLSDPSRYYGNDTDEDERKKQDKEAFDKMWDGYAKTEVQQFLRTGFQQATETLGQGNPYQVFASPAMITNKATNEETPTLVEKPVVSQEPFGVDKELFDLVVTACNDRNWKKDSPEEVRKVDDKFRKDAQRLVQEKGASIETSHSLQACACTQVLEYLEYLLTLISEPSKRLQAMNCFDLNGVTPLMAGARSFPAEKTLLLCNRLLQLGADKNIINPLDGMTALGHFRGNVRRSRDFLGLYAPRSWRDRSNDRFEEQMERLLMPFTGPTAADNSVHLS